jgi:quercetin 2,3-dioxygenase
MSTVTKAIIHLAENRGQVENEWMRSIMNFNFGNYRAENREPFGSLQVFNEDTLAAGKSLQMLPEENTDVLLIPLSGTVLFTNKAGDEIYINPGQVQLFSAAKQSSYSLSNPFKKEELVSFLQIWLQAKPGIFSHKLQQFNFHLSVTNQLQPLITAENLNSHTFCYIGKYHGRHKGNYVVQNKASGVYAFVLQGAFEMEDRLLHAKDGLAIWNTDTIDFEALSNDAMLILLEIPL